MKFIVLVALLILNSAVLADTAVPAGVSYFAGTTSNSTPITFAPPTGYFIDMNMKILNSNGAGVTGLFTVTSGAETCEYGSPAPGGGGWAPSGWEYPAPTVNGVSPGLNNKIIITDVSGIGIQYKLKFWCGTSRNNRP